MDTSRLREERRRARRVATRRLAVLVVLLCACLCLTLSAGGLLAWTAFLLPLLVGAAAFFELGALLTAVVAATATLSRLHIEGALGAAALRDTLLAVAAFAVCGLLLGRSLRRQRQRESRLAAATLHDRLTGLYNYATFADLLATEASRVDRYGGQLTLIMLDLDRFKRFNDRYGHEAGNVLLRRLGATLRDLVRDADVAARYGGEEFAVLIRGDELDGMRLAERIRLAVLTMRVPLDGQEVYVSVSAGVACYPQHAADPDELVALADAALYASKQAGRNLVTGYSLGLGMRRSQRSSTALRAVNE